MFMKNRANPSRFAYIRDQTRHSCSMKTTENLSTIGKASGWVFSLTGANPGRSCIYAWRKAQKCCPLCDAALTARLGLLSAALNLKGSHCKFNFNRESHL